MTDNKNNNNLTPETTTPETTTKPAATPAPLKCRDWGSMQTGVPISEIKLKSVLELRREFGENWM